MTPSYVLAFTILGIALLFVGYILGKLDERKKQDAKDCMATYGKVEEWELEYLPEWRGWDVIGVYHENAQEMTIRLFIPELLAWRITNANLWRIPTLSHKQPNHD